MTRIKTLAILALLGVSTCTLNAASKPVDDLADLPGAAVMGSVLPADEEKTKEAIAAIEDLFDTALSISQISSTIAPASVMTAAPTVVSGVVPTTITAASRPSRSGQISHTITSWAAPADFVKPSAATLKSHCESLVTSGLPAQQRTFDSTLQFTLPSGAEGASVLAGLKEYSVQNICVLYDVSGSTYSTDDGRGGGRGSRGGGGGGRFSRVMMADEEASVLSACLVPDAPSKSEPKTKPIFIAQAEGLSLLLKALSHTKAQPSSLYMLAFDSKPYLPIGINFPQEIKDPKEYKQIAENLDSILPYCGGGTSLAPALTVLRGALEKSPPADTLLVIVTDGQTDDADATGKLLTGLSASLTAAERRLDILTIGAGSIVSQSKAGLALDVNDQGRLMLSCTRFSHFSHATGGSSSYSGAQCNDAYLKALTYFKTDQGGRGRYCGAYRDYQDMQQVVLELLSGVNDGSYELWVQGDLPGTFWAPKAHQWDIVRDYKANGKEVDSYEYDRNAVHAIVNKDPAAGGVLRVTDDYGKIRCYLFEQKSQLLVKTLLDGNGQPTRSFAVTSAIPEIQARIKWIEEHPYK